MGGKKERKEAGMEYIGRDAASFRGVEAGSEAQGKGTIRAS